MRKLKDFTFCMDGETKHVTIGDDDIGLRVTIGNPESPGLTFTLKRTGEHKVFIAVPLVLSYRNMILFFSVIEHELIHSAILESGEDWFTSAWFDDTWLGGKYADILLWNRYGEAGYERQMFS